MWFRKRHTESTKNTVYEGFPESLRDDVKVVLEFLDVSKCEPHRGEHEVALSSGELIRVPARVYFPKTRIEQVGSLTPQQLAIFSALMTRHHDGYQRECWARTLCEYPTVWTAPFVVELLGDYVIQILQALDEGIGDEWQPIVEDFAALNDSLLEPLSHRILGYWHIYYRWFPPNIRRLNEYPGYLVACRLGLWKQGVAKRLIDHES